MNLKIMRRRRIRLLCVGAVFLWFSVIAGSFTAHAAPSEKPAAKQPGVATQPASAANNWGIEVTSVRLTAHNYMVDFRYRVLDAKKAETLFSKKIKPYLVNQETGKVLAVPRTAKVGPLMSSYHPQQDRIYWMFFSNRGNHVKEGDKVSIVIGDFKAENLTIE